MGLSESLRIVLRDYAESLILAIVLALLVRLFVVGAYRIPSDRMAPTLVRGDFVLAYKIPFGLRWPFVEKKTWQGRPPKRGEIVVFRCPGFRQKRCLKRVAAVEGDRLEIREGGLFINEKAQGFPPASAGLAAYGPVVVPPGHFFALSDDLQSPEDSRSWGAVRVEDLDGRVLMIWLSLDWDRGTEHRQWPSVRWERLFQWIH